MSILEWHEAISLLQAEANEVPLQNLLSFNCPNDFIDRINTLVENMEGKRELYISLSMISEIFKALEALGIHEDQILAYNRRYFDSITLNQYFLQVIIVLYGAEIGIQIKSGIVDEILPDLSYNSDGLLVRNEDEMSFEKDGVLYHDYYLMYSQEFYEYNLTLSGGFLGALMQFIRCNDDASFGVAIDRDIILDRRYYREYLTKAFIRGPQTISVDLLRDPSFPEDKRGTVTEYQRLDDDPLKRLLFDVDKIQVMWSSRDNRKTIQIEEIVPNKSSVNDYVDFDYLCNRFVHAIWDTNRECFCHIDGAVNKYEKRYYQERLDKDIKHYDERPTHKKLFRLDSPVDLVTFCDMTARYLYGNELVSEYFGSAHRLVT